MFTFDAPVTSVVIATRKIDICIRMVSHPLHQVAYVQKRITERKYLSVPGAEYSC
jgi:hypothetical protein